MSGARFLRWAVVGLVALGAVALLSCQGGGGSLRTAPPWLPRALGLSSSTEARVALDPSRAASLRVQLRLSAADTERLLARAGASWDDCWRPGGDISLPRGWRGPRTHLERLSARRCVLASSQLELFLASDGRYRVLLAPRE